MLLASPDPLFEEFKMPPPVRKDPFPAANFRIEIDGLTAAAFLECSGLESETEVIDYRLGTDPGPAHKIPGVRKFTNIVLKRGITTDRQLWDWYKSVLDGAVARRNFSIVLMDEKGQDVLRWNVHDGWPAKYTGPVLNAASCDVAIETLEIAHEGFELA
jgi:phage tail-like protein